MINASHINIIIKKSLTGVGQYSMKKKALQTGFGGIFDKGENLFAAHWAMDNNVSHAFTSI